MRAVVQRVTSSSVRVGEEITGQIELGLLVLLGIAEGDTDTDARYLAEKVVGLRVFQDPEGKMNLCLSEVGGKLLVVSQFTLLGDCRKGRRPSFIAAAEPEQAGRLCDSFVRIARGLGVEVACGRFRAHMQVSLVNDGPVTLILDSHKQF